MKIKDNTELWNDSNCILEKYDGFTYGFENEDCKDKFLKLKLHKWHLCVHGKIVNILRKQNWRFFVCDVIEDDEEAAGMCFYEEKILTIRNMDPMPNALFHELGHVFQAYAKSLDRPIINYVIALEGSTFCEVLAGYYLKGTKNPDLLTQNFVMSQMSYFLNSREYIAQSIALIIYGYEPFRLKCPLSYHVATLIVQYYDGGKEKLIECEEKLGLI